MGEISKTIGMEDRPEDAARWVLEMLRKGLHLGPVLITLSRPKRTRDQNSLLWPCLEDISRQVDWYGQKLSKEEWKDVLTAGLKKQKVVPDITGNGFVVIGAHTSKMSKEEFSQLLELIFAFGVEQGVKFTDPKPTLEE